MMRKSRATLIGASFFLQFLVIATAQDVKPDDASSKKTNAEKSPAFKFVDVEYFHRFTEKELNEYTPKDQEDLDHWSDMVSIVYHPDAKDGDALAKAANAKLALYAALKGNVVNTYSIPKTAEKAAEHIVVVVFRRPDFYEVAFNRFVLHDGIGKSVVYSHRTYGEKAYEQMIEWSMKNVPTTEPSLRSWNDFPKTPETK